MIETWQTWAGFDWRRDVPIYALRRLNNTNGDRLWLWQEVYQSTAQYMPAYRRSVGAQVRQRC